MNPLVCHHCHSACTPPVGYAGQPLVCPSCGQLILHAAPMATVVSTVQGSQEVPLYGPIAPPMMASLDVADAELIDEFQSQRAAVQAASEGIRSRQMTWLFLVLLLVTSGMFLLASIAVGYVIVTRARGQSIASPLGSTDTLWQRKSGEPRDAIWTQAEGQGVHVGPARVEIVRVEIGEARGKDTSGNVVISEGDFLHILLRIENTSPLPLEYQSWYGNDFGEPRDGKRLAQRVRLLDNTGRTYSWVIFDDVERVRWHTPQATIPPRKSVEDVIVFQLPVGATKQNLHYLRLELPAEALGFRDGFYRFEIPRTMIEGIAP